MDRGENGIFRKLLGYFRQLQEMEISVHASHACYFMVLSLFPALTLILSLLRYTPLEAADLMEAARGLLPDALELQVWRLISGIYEYTSRTVVSLSALVTLWSASRGVRGLMTGLNGVYGRQERRSWLRTRLMCAGYTVLFVLVLLLTLVLHVFGSTLEAWLQAVGKQSLTGLGFFLLVAVQTLVFAAMFMFLPEGKNSFRDSIPGAVFGSLGWMTFSTLFSFYVENWGSRRAFYGSVYGAVLGMLWLYMCVSILFYGGALNRFLAGNRGNMFSL